MRRIITAVFFMVVTLTLCARDLSVQVSPTRLSVLPGAPMDVTLTVTNKAGHDLLVLGDSLRHGVRIRTYLYTLGGTKVDCWKESVSWVTGHSPPSTWPRHRFPAGGTITVPSGIYSHTACPLSQIPPGRYEGRIIVAVNILIGEQDRTISSEVRIPVEVRQPTGQDAAYLKALQDALRTYESQAGPVKLKGVPLTWREVLSSFRIRSAQIALTRFPTSTYAGYALGLGQGFHMILDSKPEYVVKTLWQQNYIQAHPKASTHQKVVEGGKAREVWQTEPMPKYLEDQRSRIQNYLVIHPGHPRREVMELALAYQSLALGDKDTALHTLEWVSKNGKTPKWKKQAIDLLKLLKAEKSGANS